MKLTVIGHWGAYPEVGEATSGYLISYENFNLLLDCGSGILSHIQRFIKIEDIHAVLLSHYHHDHIADIGPLQYARLTKTQVGQINDTMPIYGHGDNAAFDKLTKEPYTKGVSYAADKPLHIGPFTITFFKTAHAVTCYAVKISANDKTIVYSADTNYFEALIPFVKGADLFICECSLYADMDGKSMGHMNSTDCGKMAREANVGQLLLTHLPHFGDHAQLLVQAKQEYSGIASLASMGWT